LSQLIDFLITFAERNAKHIFYSLLLQRSFSPESNRQTDTSDFSLLTA